MRVSRSIKAGVAAVASGMRALSDSVEQLVCMGHDDDFDPLLGTVMVASALQAGELPLSLRDSLVLERTMRNA